MAFISRALKGYNFIGAFFGAWGPMYRNGTDPLMSGEPLGQSVNSFNESLGINNLGLLQDAVHTYIESREADIAKLLAIQTRAGKSLDDLGVWALLDDCFKYPTEVPFSPEKFKDHMDNVQNYIGKKESKYCIKDLVDYVDTIKKEAINAIKIQQDRESLSINQHAFGESLKALGVPDYEIHKLKDKIVTHLQKSHKEHLDTLRNSMSDALEKIKDAVKTEGNRVAFLNLIYKNNEEAKNEIDKWHKQNQKPGESAVVIEGNKAFFKGIKAADIEMFKTITGRQVTRNKSDGSYCMSFPHHWLTFHDRGYYLDYANNRKRDGMTLALAMLACGYASVLLQVNQGQNEEEAMEAARDVYASFIEAGFKDKDIQLEVNGKKVSSSELFASCPSLLQASQRSAEDNERRRKKNQPLSSTINRSADFQDKLYAFIAKQEEEKEYAKPEYQALL